MVLVQSDREDISICILDECKKSGIVLNESARNMLNAKALGIFCREKSMQKMREMIRWEIAFLAPKMLQRASDRDLIISETGEPRKGAAVAAYLSGIGCPLHKRGKLWWTTVPKSYDYGAVKKRIASIKNS